MARAAGGLHQALAAVAAGDRRAAAELARGGDLRRPTARRSWGRSPVGGRARRLRPAPRVPRRPALGTLRQLGAPPPVRGGGRRLLGPHRRRDLSAPAGVVGLDGRRQHGPRSAGADVRLPSPSDRCGPRGPCRSPREGGHTHARRHHRRDRPDRQPALRLPLDRRPPRVAADPRGGPRRGRDRLGPAGRDRRHGGTRGCRRGRPPRGRADRQALHRRAQAEGVGVPRQGHAGDRHRPRRDGRRAADADLELGHRLLRCRP